MQCGGGGGGSSGGSGSSDSSSGGGRLSCARFGHAVSDLPLTHIALGKGAIVDRAWAPRRVVEDGLPETRRLGKLDVAANRGHEDFRAVPRQATSFGFGEEIDEFVDDFAAMSGLGFVHAQHDASDPEARIQALREQLHGFEKLGESLHRQELRLHRNDDFLGKAEAVKREHAEARRAVDENEVELIADLLESLAQNAVSIGMGGELGFGTSEVGG